MHPCPCPDPALTPAPTPQYDVHNRELEEKFNFTVDLSTTFESITDLFGTMLPNKTHRLPPAVRRPPPAARRLPPIALKRIPTQHLRPERRGDRV